ncbi:MAG: stage 0 sporulation family protein [Clostridia bacterium]|nr:stage 0 sporulation family protein [Clostridia bacterium]
MVKVIEVKFKTSGRSYYFDPLDFNIKQGDGVIVETARGTEYGEASSNIKELEPGELIAPLKPVLRIATPEDTRMRAEYSAKEADALALCQQRVAAHKLDMKLVDAEYTFNGSKVVFYFTADERVDFRELVKDLAFHFKTRIELRQIGVRDEAKMLGGLGSCGRPVCCKTFLDDFRPVSIKMAKEQNLSLSPTKISGLCGRLMCCLQYEQEAYETMHKKMPKLGKTVVTADGIGTVVDNDVITEKTKVRLTMDDGTIDVREYHYTLLASEGEPAPKIPVSPARTEPEKPPRPREPQKPRPKAPPQEQAEKPSNEEPHQPKKGGFNRNRRQKRPQNKPAEKSQPTSR